MDGVSLHVRGKEGKGRDSQVTGTAGRAPVAAGRCW